MNTSTSALTHFCTRVSTRVRHWLAIGHPALPTLAEDETMALEFQRYESQVRAIHQLEIWRAARNQRFPITTDCPSRPRLISGILTLEEQEHIEICKHCQYVLASVRFYWIKQSIYRLRERGRGLMDRVRRPIGDYVSRVTRIVRYLTYAFALLTGGFLLGQRWQTPRPITVLLPSMRAAPPLLTHEEDQLLHEVQKLQSQLRAYKGHKSSGETRAIRKAIRQRTAENASAGQACSYLTVEQPGAHRASIITQPTAQGPDQELQRMWLTWLAVQQASPRYAAEPPRGPQH